MDLSIRHIFHPSDLTPASQAAFEHALRMAIAAKAKLTVMHVMQRSGDEEWDAFPGVRDVLERWKMLPAGAGVEAIESLGVTVRKVSAQASEPSEACIDHLERHPAQLIVMATGQNGRGAGLWNTSVSGRIAAQAGITSLFLPQATKGFIQASNGKVEVRRILVPIDRSPDPAPAFEATDGLVTLLSIQNLIRATYHAGTEATMNMIEGLPALSSGWQRSHSTEDPVHGILSAVDRFGPDLLVMVTQGRRGLRDALLGSTTERVLSSVQVPVLAVPCR